MKNFQDGGFGEAVKNAENHLKAYSELQTGSSTLELSTFQSHLNLKCLCSASIFMITL